METPTIYLTKEQIVRLAGLSCDALVGIQIHTDDSDQTDLTCEFVHIDRPDLTCYWIGADGNIQETT